MRSKKTIITLALATMLTALAAAATLARPATVGPLQVEVAEIGARFVFDPDLVDDDGVPTRGNDFVAEGYVYEANTLTCDDGVCDGVVYDAEGNPAPEFPDRIIGTWTCWGTHTEDAATTTSGDIVATTQVYDFGEELGEESIVTTGFERIDDVPIDRAIVGGTGRAGITRGTATQSLQGLNNPDGAFGVTLFVEFSRTS